MSRFIRTLGRMAGVIAVGLFCACSWFVGRATLYLVGGD